MAFGVEHAALGAQHLVVQVPLSRLQVMRALAGRRSTLDESFQFLLCFL